MREFKETKKKIEDILGYLGKLDEAGKNGSEAPAGEMPEDWYELISEACSYYLKDLEKEVRSRHFMH